MNINPDLVVFVISHYLVLGSFLLIAYIVGDRLLKNLELERGAPRIYFCTSTGLGALTVTLFYLMLFKVFYLKSVLLIIALLVLVSLASRQRKTILLDALSLIRSAGPAFSRHWYWLIPAFLFFGYMSLLPLYPPIHHDELTYHLPYAKYYVEQGGLAVNPYLRYAVNPHNFQILYALALVLYDEVLAHLFHATAAFLTMWGIYCVGKDSAGPATGVLALLIFGTSSMVMYLVSTAYIDLGLMFYVFLGFYSLYMWSTSDGQKWLYLAGFACGLAIGTKYSGLVFVLIFGLWIALEQKKLLPLLKFLLPAIIFGAPWYIRNYLITGDPFFPGGGNLFGYSWYWSARDMAGQMYDMTDAHGTPRTLVSFLQLPYNLVMNPELFKQGSISYLMVLAFGSVFLFKRFSRFYKFLTGLVFTCIVLWFFSTQIIRYLLPVFPLIALLSARTMTMSFTGLGKTLDRLLGKTSFIKRTLELMTGYKLRSAGKIFVLLALVTIVQTGTAERFLSAYPSSQKNNTYPTKRVRNNPIPVNAGEREALLDRKIPGYSLAMLANKEQFKNVYHFGFARLKYFFEGAVLGDWFGPAAYRNVFTRIDNQPELFEYLRSINVDLLMLEKDRFYGLLKEGQAERFLADIRAGTNPKFELVLETDSGILLRLDRELHW